MKLNEVLNKSIQFFKDKKIESARLDAELLISHALKIPRIQLYVKYDQPLSDEEVNLCRDYIRRRSAGEPVAYILQEKYFYGLKFIVKPGVLIPRPETEIIVEQVLNEIKNITSKVRVLDLGSGTGCVGLSIAKNNTNVELVSVERSKQAFEILNLNIENLNLQNQVTAIHDDVLNLQINNQEHFDYILANPPYIDINDPETESNVKKFEPEEALFSKEQGFQDLKQWSQYFSSFLNKNGLMIFEMGYKQGITLKEYFENLNKFSRVEILKDLSGLDRFIKARA